MINASSGSHQTGFSAPRAASADPEIMQVLGDSGVKDRAGRSSFPLASDPHTIVMPAPLVIRLSLTVLP